MWERGAIRATRARIEAEDRQERLSRFLGLLAIYRDSWCDACSDEITQEQRNELLQQAEDTQRQMTEMIR